MLFDLLVSLLTLTFMEIVLGIDNIIFISISTDKLPQQQQKKARLLGITLALLIRIVLLAAMAWMVGLSEPIASIRLPARISDTAYDLSWHDLILFAGGLFLIAKSTTEIHAKIEGADEKDEGKKQSVLAGVVLQIVLLDIVFSFDSILTAIGLIELPGHAVSPLEIMRSLPFWVMVTAVGIGMAVMLLSSGQVAAFINRHPTVKILALSFLLLIGFMLLLEGLHIDVPKGYIYFAIFFSLFVEVINMRVRKKMTNKIKKARSKKG